jgi:hypothetical protein
MKPPVYLSYTNKNVSKIKKKRGHMYCTRTTGNITSGYLKNQQNTTCYASKVEKYQLVSHDFT